MPRISFELGTILGEPVEGYSLEINLTNERGAFTPATLGDDGILIGRTEQIETDENGAASVSVADNIYIKLLLRNDQGLERGQFVAYTGSIDADFHELDGPHG